MARVVDSLRGRMPLRIVPHGTAKTKPIPEFWARVQFGMIESLDCDVVVKSVFVVVKAVTWDSQTVLPFPTQLIV